MKLFKVSIITFISLTLVACTNSPSLKENNNEPKRLSNYTQNYPNNEDTSNANTQNTRLPASGKNSAHISDENIILDEDPTTITTTYEKEPNNGSSNDKIVNNEKIDKNLISSYSSKVYTKTEDRQKNLKIVCDKLSGIILKPNEEFSYNTTCGPFNKENGFGKATVFLGDGTEKEDYGGRSVPVE